MAKLFDIQLQHLALDRTGRASVFKAINVAFLTVSRPWCLILVGADQGASAIDLNCAAWVAKGKVGRQNMVTLNGQSFTFSKDIEKMNDRLKDGIFFIDL
jgi:hypothetical protein